MPLAALVVGLGAPSPAAAEPPEVYEGYFVGTSFELHPGETTGAVTRFSFDFSATVHGDLSGTFTEHQDCRRVGDVVRCHGTATAVDADGSTGFIRSRITCTPELVCHGRANGRGTRTDGRLAVWHTVVSPGPGVGLYETRFVRGGPV